MRGEHGFELWITPDGTLVARVFHTYDGIRGQERVCLVDRQGRVHHYDTADVVQALWCDACAEDLP